MGFRFRKRIRIVKGLYLNLGKLRGSLSFGGRGATMNVSKKGVRDTFSLPGTGISYQTKRVGIKQPHRSAKGPPQSVSPMSVLAFVLVRDYPFLSTKFCVNVHQPQGCGGYGFQARQVGGIRMGD